MFGSGLKVGDLYGELRLERGNFDRDIASAGGTFGNLAGIAVKAGLVAGAALVGVGAAATVMAAGFQTSMANVHTLLGPGSEAEARIKALGTDVKTMSVETGKSLDDLAGGLYMVISAFGDTSDSSEILRLSAKAGVAGLSTTTDAINLLSAVTKGYGDTSTAAVEKASDLAFMTVRLGQTTFPELAASMGKAIPLAKALGVSQEELFGAMATLTGVTGNTAEVSTQLRAVFQAIVAGNPDMVDALKALGFESGQAAVEELGLAGTMAALQKSTGGSTVKLKDMFGSVEAVSAVLALTGPQAEDFANKTAQMGDAAGETSDAFEIQQKTVAATFSRVQRSFDVILVTLGEKFLPMLQGVLDWVIANMPAIQATFEGVFDTIGKAVSFVTDVIIPGIIDAFGGANNTVLGLGDQIMGFVSGAWAALQSAFEWFSTNVGPVIAAAIDGIRQVADSLGEGLQGFADNIMPAVSSAFDWFGKNVLPAIQDGLKWLVTDVIPPLVEALSWLAENVLPALGDILGWLLNDIIIPLADAGFKFLTEVVLPPLRDILDFIATQVLPPLSAAFDWLVTNVLPPLRDLFTFIVDEVLPPLLDILGKIADFISDVFDAAITFLTEVVLPPLQVILGLISTAFETVLGWLRSIADFISTVFNIAVDLAKDAVDGFNDALADGKTKGEEWAQAIRDGEAPVGGLWDMIQEKGILGLFEFSQAINTTADEFSTSGSWIQDIINQIGATIEVVKAQITIALDALGAYFHTNFEIPVNNAMTSVQTTIDTIVTQIQTAFTTLQTAIGTMVESVRKPLEDMFSPLTDGINEALTNVRNAWNGFARFWNGINIKIPEVNIPYVGTFGGNQIGLPNLPTFAAGGDVFRDLYGMVGEHGPELMALPAGAHVFSNAETQGILGGRGLSIGNISIGNIAVPEGANDPRAFARATVDAIGEEAAYQATRMSEAVRNG